MSSHLRLVKNQAATNHTDRKAACLRRLERERDALIAENLELRRMLFAEKAARQHDRAGRTDGGAA